MSPRFVADLADRVDAEPDSVDVVLAARGLDGPSGLRPCAREDHARVARALGHREGVRTFEDEHGGAVVILGRGLAGRLEVAFEVEKSLRGRGLARVAAGTARRRVHPDRRRGAALPARRR